MTDTWAGRFNMTHVPAGSATGGQFGTSSGGSASAAAKTPAKAAPAAAMSPAHAAEKARLLAEARKDAHEAALLEKQLGPLEKQEKTAAAASKKSAASAKAALKAGHILHHHKHTAAHHGHRKHAESLKKRITDLKTRIHALREQAAGLEKQANAIRAAGAVTSPGGTGKVHEYWVHGEGAAKVRWGEAGDFDRCVMHLGKFIKDPQGYCAKAHHEALGIWPATHAAMEHKAGRADMAKQDVTDKPPSAVSRVDAVYFRTYELEDIHIVRAGQGDSTGRLVEAYAAVFDSPAEIVDHEGHYVEVIDPAAFNKAVADASRSRAGFGKVKVMYNHGMTIHGTPSERGSMPVGTPVDIRPETRGLLTLTRYSETPFADEVLENIRNGAITAQSFTGRIVRSDPQLGRRDPRHRADSAGNLRTVRRTELGLREYGPTPFEAYSGAEILGVRMSTPGALDVREQEPDQYDDEALLPDGEAAAGEPLTRADGDGEEHSARYHQHALYRLNSAEARERAGLVW